MQTSSQTPVDLVIHLAANVGGIGINRANKERQVMTVVLPAADVLEIAEQAKTAKPIVQEEKPKAADDESKPAKKDEK